MPFRSFLSAAATLLAVYGISGSASAQQSTPDQVDVQAQDGQLSVEVDGPRDRESIRNRQGSRASSEIAHRATEIQGMTVKNSAGKELGSVEDIVIDARSGEVKYAALSYGGFLGLGDKLFAVPWAALEYRHDSTDNDEGILVLDIDEAKLKNAPGFDQDAWPDFADGTVANELQQHYGQPVRRNGRGVEINAGRVNVDVNLGRNSNREDAGRRERPAAASADHQIHRASEIIGMTVKDSTGEDVGSIDDLVIVMQSGKVRYAALSFGGTLGLGEKLVAVPWDAFQCQYDADDEEAFLVVAIAPEPLRSAPSFDQNNWPKLSEPGFGDQIDQYYEGLRRSNGRRADRQLRDGTDR